MTTLKVFKCKFDLMLGLVSNRDTEFCAASLPAVEFLRSALERISMNSRLMLMLALFLGVFVFTLKPTAQAQSGDASVLLKMEADFQKATAEKGWDGYVTYFADDGVELPNGESAVKGKQAIRKSLGDWAPGMSLTWTSTGSAMAASGDLGYTYGEYTLKTKN